MRKDWAGRFLERFFITLLAGMAVIGIMMMVSPPPQPITLVCSVIISSFIISAWMEWVRTRQYERARRGG